MEDALHEAHIQIRDKDDEIAELKDVLQQTTQEISDFQKENSSLRIKAAGMSRGGQMTDSGFPNVNNDDFDEMDEDGHGGMNLTNSMARIDYERHAKEIMDMLGKTVKEVLVKVNVNSEDNRNDNIGRGYGHAYSSTTYGVSNLGYNATNSSSLSHPNAFSVAQSNQEIDTLLQRLEDEIEVLSTFVNERDRAIELLSNRLGVIKMAHKSIDEKYRVLRGKYLNQDDDSDLEQYGMGDDRIRDDGSDISELEKSAGVNILFLFFFFRFYFWGIIFF